MTARVQVIGNAELQNLIKDIAKRGDNMCNRLLAEGAFNTQNAAVRSIQAHESQGASYIKYVADHDNLQVNRVAHVASAPGHPPNTDTGQLVSNITIKKIEGGYDVGSRSGAPHGLWLEYGTAKMAPRPWLSTAFEKIVKPLIEKYVRMGL